MLRRRHIILGMSLLMLSACMSRTEAPVIYHGASDGITREIKKIIQADPTFGTIIDQYKWIFPKNVPNVKPQEKIIAHKKPAPPKAIDTKAPPKPIKKSEPEKILTAATPAGTFIKPVQGKIISSFGAKADGQRNDGINIKADRGTTVRAAQNGEVIYADDDLEGFGNLVLIRHEKSFVTAYAHLQDIAVTKGQSVRQGDMIGSVGSTGNVSTPQLHFEIRNGAKPLNPQTFVKY